jgi:plasmid maintenance system antidote protein VapI
MSLLGVATAMGVPTHALEELLRGKVTIPVAVRLGVISSAAQDFVDGRVGISMAQAIGTLASTAQELRNKIGREGAIGLIVGMCIARNRADR